MLNKLLMEEHVKSALIEDIGYGDITTENLAEDDDKLEGFLNTREDGILCGCEVFKTVYKMLSSDIKIDFHYKDGDVIKKGDRIATLKGPAKELLMGERLALNYIQRMSGIATETNKYQEAIAPFRAKIVDTRKTTPNFRMFEKYAVKTGGGALHRFNLSDCAMIKDNHIRLAGSITKAVEKLRKNISHAHKIEVECDTLEQVKEAVSVCLKSRNIWLAGIALMLMLGGATVISNFQVTALTTLRNYSEALAGTFGTVLMVGSIVGSIFVPVALGKSPRHAPVMLLIFGLISAATMVIMVLTESVALNYVACFLNGGLRSGFIAAMMSLPVLFKEVGPKYAGTGGGLMVTLELIGAVLIPTYVVVPLGGGSVLNYFYLGAVCIVASAILCFIMAKTSGAYATEKETV